MEQFQKILIFMAILILIITLVSIGITIKKQKLAGWPPIIGDCPDYWVDISGNGQRCVNVKDLGTCKSSTTKHLNMDFTSSEFTGDNSLCAKYTWANNCGVSWDGVTYGVSNPCNKT
jgi:hypothetical protein